MNFNNIINDMRYRIIIQLYKEYDNICFQYRINLKKPLIILSDLKSVWGNWDPIGKVITLSFHLIQDYPWDVVIGILKHEIAHQIATDVFFSKDIHGSSFQKACEIIGVPKEYCKASLDMEKKLSHWKDNEFQDDDMVILRKLEKLLNLAQSANEYEALLAMEKVQELYSKYNIKRIQDGIQPEFFSLIINLKKKNAPSTFIHIASLIQGHYFVNVVFSELYDPLCDESYKVIEILGTRHNVLMAEYVFYFLKEQIDSLWAIYQKEKSAPGRYKLSYQKGILVGFQSKLDKIQKEKIKNEMKLQFNENKLDMHQLIKLEDAKLNEFTKKMFPRLSKKDSSSHRVYTEHYDEGKNEGKKMILSKPVSTSKSQPGLLGVGKNE
jgi:Protein of unknown function (DUF2786)/SprT-like family